MSIEVDVIKLGFVKSYYESYEQAILDRINAIIFSYETGKKFSNIKLYFGPTRFAIVYGGEFKGHKVIGIEYDQMFNPETHNDDIIKLNPKIYLADSIEELEWVIRNIDTLDQKFVESREGIANRAIITHD